MGNLTVFRSNNIDGDVIFRVNNIPEIPAIEVEWDIPNGNMLGSSITIDDPYAQSPVIYMSDRPGTRTQWGWRSFAFRLRNAEGRTPQFRVDSSNREVSYNASIYRPVYTTDYETWINSSTFSVGGSPSAYQFTFGDPLPAGDIYVHNFPCGRQVDAVDFAEYLLTDHDTVAAPLDSADENGVIYTIGSRFDDVGREVGIADIYGIGLEFGGSTTDGLRKRNICMTYGIHAAGESAAWVSFKEFVKYLVNSSDAAAQNLRANFDWKLYFNLNPCGHTGGHGGGNFFPGAGNSNAVWYPGTSTQSDSVPEIDATRSAIISDYDGIQMDVQIDWHMFPSDLTVNHPRFEESQGPLTGLRTPCVQGLLDYSQIIFGSAPKQAFSSTPDRCRYWMTNSMNCPNAFTVEMPSGGTVTYAFYETLGTNWAKILEATDQDGLIISDTAIKGIRLTLHQGSTPVSAHSNVQVAFFDQPEPKDFDAPVFTAGNGSITSQGEIEIDIDQATALDVGQFGSVLIYKLDTNDHRNSQVFFSRVEVIDISE